MWQQQEGKYVQNARTPELFGDVIDQFVHTHLSNGGRQGVGIQVAAHGCATFTAHGGYLGWQFRQGVDRRSPWVAVESETQHRGRNAERYTVVAVGGDALYQGCTVFAVQDIGAHDKQGMVLAYQFVESARSGFPGPSGYDRRLANSGYDYGVAAFPDNGECRVRILCPKRLHQGAEHGQVAQGTGRVGDIARDDGETRGRFRQDGPGCRGP